MVFLLRVSVMNKLKNVTKNSIVQCAETSVQCVEELIFHMFRNDEFFLVCLFVPGVARNLLLGERDTVESV